MCDFPVEKHCFADHVRTITESLVGYKMTLTHEKNKPFYNEIYNYTQKDKNIYLQKIVCKLIGND